MGQARCSEDQRHAQRNQIERTVGRLVIEPGRQEVLGDGLAVCLVADLTGGGEERPEIEAEMREHEDAQQQRAAHQQDGLDDLHPGRRQHAAEDDVDDHQDADACHRAGEADAGIGEKQTDQGARADHLSDHVKRRNGQRAQRRPGPHRTRPEPVGEHVGHGVFPGISQRFGDNEEHGQVGDQEAHRVHETVEAVERDQPGDP